LFKHDFLSELLETKSGTHEYYGRIQSLKNRLEKEHSIFLETEHKKGYRIVFTDEIYKHVDGCIEQKTELLRKQYRKTTYIPIQKMSEPARNETLAGLQKHASLMMMLNVGAKSKMVNS